MEKRCPYVVIVMYMVIVIVVGLHRSVGDTNVLTLLGSYAMDCQLNQNSSLRQV